MMPPTALIKQAFAIANTAVVADIEMECHQVMLGGWVFYDTRPMVDPNEHDPQVVDMARQAIDYALQAGLAMQHPTRPELLRILRPTP